MSAIHRVHWRAASRRLSATSAKTAGHVQFPDWQMEAPNSARLPLARSGEKSRRAPSVGELQMAVRAHRSRAEPAVVSAGSGAS